MRAMGFAWALAGAALGWVSSGAALAADGDRLAAVSASAVNVKIISRAQEPRAGAKAEATAEAKSEATPEARPETAHTLAKADPGPAAELAPRAKPKVPKPVAKKKKRSKPLAPTLKASIDLSRQRMTVTQSNGNSYTWKISSGRKGYHTPTGSFRPKWKTKMHYSKQYDNAPMPHSVFFHGGYAVHATNATGRLGRPASHGCIRLSPSNAKTFYRLVSKHGNSRTRISIRGRTPAASTYVAKKRPNRYVPKSRPAKYARRPAYKPKYAPAYKPKYSYKKKYAWPGDAPRYRTTGDPRIYR